MVILTLNLYQYYEKYILTSNQGNITVLVMLSSSAVVNGLGYE